MEQKQTAQPLHGCFFCNVAGPQIEALLGHLCPEETHKHFRAARLEMLKGFRSLLDARIEHLSQHQQQGTKVTVE
jgi:hypothetical protein